MNSANMTRYLEEVWKKKNLSIIDELVHHQAIVHPITEKIYGPTAMRQTVSTWFSAFPDLSISILGMINQQEKIMVRWSSQGTHLGHFKEFPPSNNKVNFSGASIYRFQNHQIIEYWSYIDMENLISQIK